MPVDTGRGSADLRFRGPRLFLSSSTCCEPQHRGSALLAVYVDAQGAHIT
jgi:hypothetical protein